MFDLYDVVFGIGKYLAQGHLKGKDDSNVTLTIKLPIESEDRKPPPVPTPTPMLTPLHHAASPCR